MGRVITGNLKKNSVGGMRTSRVGKSQQKVASTRSSRMSGARMAGPRASSTVAAVLGSEKRGCDFALDVGTVGGIVATTNTNADAVCVNCVQEGAGTQNRQGRKIFMKSLRLKGFARGYIASTAGGVVRQPLLRQVVVYDRSPQGLPTFDTIFGITTDAGAESCPNVMCPPRYDNMNRFTVLSDTVIDFTDVTPFSTTSSVWIEKEFDTYVPLKNLETTFKSTTNPGSVNDISTGALYVFYRASSQVNPEAQVQTVAIARLRFY